jgi:hypothetical protein
MAVIAAGSPYSFKSRNPKRGKGERQMRKSELTFDPPVPREVSPQRDMMREMSC